MRRAAEAEKEVDEGCELVGARGKGEGKKKSMRNGKERPRSFSLEESGVVSALMNI